MHTKFALSSRRALAAPVRRALLASPRPALAKFTRRPLALFCRPPCGALALICIAGAAPGVPQKPAPSTQPKSRDAELARKLLGEDSAGHDSLRKMLSLMN